jgi:hypothetical protein
MVCGVKKVFKLPYFFNHNDFNTHFTCQNALYKCKHVAPVLF